MDYLGMSTSVKDNIINQNKFHLEKGIYKDLPTYSCMISEYINNYDSGDINDLCNVHIIHQNSTNILDNIGDKGIENLNIENENPVVVHFLSKKFDPKAINSFQDSRDNQILLRTNFLSLIREKEYFPLDAIQCLYLPLLTVLRDKEGKFIHLDRLFGFSLISTSLVSNPSLLSENKMEFDSFLTNLVVIENIFQTAIINNHSVIVLPFSNLLEHGFPLNDAKILVNFCILKYGHRFKNIIISVNEYESAGTYHKISGLIIKPKEIV